MAKLAIRFRPGDIRLLEDAPEGIMPREKVIFEIDGGLDCRPATLMPTAVVAVHKDLQVARFIRRATESDLEQLAAKSREETRAFEECGQQVRKHGLPMRLVDAIYTLDFSRLTVLYTADTRVDFRELLRDLTQVFRRTRILLRQIGARDEFRHLSGVGPCGKELCCSTFLREFAPINIKLAKAQDLQLNPGKLSGACGRLKCCLNYEVDAYREAKGRLPKAGTRVLTASGEGRVIELRAANERCLVELDDGKLLEVSVGQFNVLSASREPDQNSPSPE
jgi:cell fate regulator YaaT (PSP1 superfamily)